MKTLHQTLDASWRPGLYLMFITVCLLALSLPAAAKPKIAILATGGTIAGAKGIVVAGVGDGNMTAPALDALAALAKKGMVVVRSSPVGNGIVKRNNTLAVRGEYFADKALFFISGRTKRDSIRC